MEAAPLVALRQCAWNCWTRVHGILTKQRGSKMGDRAYEIDNLTPSQWRQVYAMWAFTLFCMATMI
jgi:hypothetical protein